MMEKRTNVIPSKTSDNDISISIEGLIMSSGLEGNDENRNKNKEKPLPDELASFSSILFLLLIPLGTSSYIDAMYRYVSNNVATNVDIDFTETIVVELLNKNIKFNKTTAQDLDSYFIADANENSEVTISTNENSEVTISTIINENVNSNSNINSDINKPSSNENTADKIHTDNIEKENAIQSSTNKKLSSGSSTISEQSSENMSLTNWSDFNANENTLKTSAEIFDNIRPPQSYINTAILVKHGQSRAELKALKNYILKIETQISALKKSFKVWLTTLANKTETVSINSQQKV